jgi:hypothetical protein
VLGDIKFKFIVKILVRMQRTGKFSVFTLSFVLLVSGLHAQTQDSYEYTSEFTWGITKILPVD